MGLERWVSPGLSTAFPVEMQALAILKKRVKSQRDQLCTPHLLGKVLSSARESSSQHTGTGVGLPDLTN